MSRQKQKLETLCRLLEKDRPKKSLPAGGGDDGVINTNGVSTGSSTSAISAQQASKDATAAALLAAGDDEPHQHQHQHQQHHHHHSHSHHHHSHAAPVGGQRNPSNTQSATDAAYADLDNELVDDGTVDPAVSAFSESDLVGCGFWCVDVTCCVVCGVV